jgi:hypothetical protein
MFDKSNGKLGNTVSRALFIAGAYRFVNAKRAIGILTAAAVQARG